MKKKIFLALASVALVISLMSCSALGAVMGQMETKYTPYVLEESSDIYGDHVTEAVLIDKQTEGLAASDFATRVLRKTVNGELEGYYLQFREQDNLSNDGYYYMTMFPLIRIDGVVYDFPLLSLPEYQTAGSIRFKEVEVKLPAEAVEALKSAEAVSVQFYSVNDKDKLVDISAEGVQAARDFVNGATSL